jgi:CheY-like chemotaxis protein
MTNSETKPDLATILIVDDRETDIMLTQLVLQEEANLECNMLVARDGSEALKMLQGASNRGEIIDLVLLDINMPGMDGFELLELMQNYPEMRRISVIMCSGSDYHKDVERAKALGAIGYVVKPAMFRVLKPVIEQSLTTKLLQTEGNGYSLRRVA